MRYVLCFLSFACLAAVSAQDVAMQGLTGGNYRFKDIGGQAYAQSFTAGYSYTAAQVTISLDSPGLNYLAGAVSATGLKPNFAYQIKIVGNPSKGATTPEQLAAADDASNEVIGSLGRWWRLKPNPANSNDADYATYKDNPDYAYEGYILIAFFVTDAQGSASVRFVGNNSYHVLWRTDQRQPGANDGQLVPVSVPDTAANPAYDAAVPARQYLLYGEWEPTRALPGTLELPSRHYRGRLFLTEESFHDSGALAGGWAVAMSAPVELDIPTTDNPSGNPPPVSALPLTITRLRASLDLAHSHRDYLWVSGTLALPAGLQIANLRAQSSVLGETRDVVLRPWGRGWVRDGIIELHPSRRGGNTAEFRIKMSRAAFVLPPPSAQSGTVNVPVTLILGGEDYAGSVLANQRLGKHRATLRYSDK